MIVLDASVWISGIRPDETHYQVSRRWLAQRRGDGAPIAVPVHFLVEVASAFSRPVDGSEAEGLDALQTVLDERLIERFELDDELAESAARAAARCRIRAGDALYVALAQELDVPLITWDGQVLDRARVLVDVQTPTA